MGKCAEIKLWLGLNQITGSSVDCLIQAGLEAEGKNNPTVE